MAAQRGGPSLRLQVLLYPVLDCNFDTPSYDAFGEGFNLDRETMKWFWNLYAPDASVRRQPLASPLRASLVSQQQDEDETHDETNETNQKLEGANV